MTKKLKYDIVAAINAHDLRVNVNNMLEKGWILGGNLVVNDNCLYQVVVFEEINNEYEEKKLSELLSYVSTIYTLLKDLKSLDDGHGEVPFFDGAMQALEDYINFDNKPMSFSSDNEADNIDDSLRIKNK